MFRKILPVFLVLSVVFGWRAARGARADQAQKVQARKPQAAKSGNTKKTKKTKKTPEEIRSDKARLYYGEALWAEMQGNYQKAIKDFTMVTVLEPRSYKSWLHIARDYRKTSRAMDAISALNNAINVEPKAPQAYLSLMESYWELGGLVKNAVHTGERAMKNGVSPAIILPDMGWYYYLANDKANASDCYKKAYKTDPKNSVLVNNMGLLLFSEGRYGDAISRFGEALKLNPGSVLAPYFEALSYNKLGKEKEALEALRKALKKDWRLPEESAGFNNKFFPWANPGDLSKLFAKLKPAPPALKNSSVKARAPKKIPSAAPPKNGRGAAKGK